MAFYTDCMEAKQIRIPIEKDEKGNDITPDQETGIISDRLLTAGEMGRIKREHLAVENKVHHVLDDTFRENRSPAKKSKNNLALIRKFSYDILRIAMLREENVEVMTEMMDEFCDDHTLIEKYVFNGIESFY